MRGKDNPCYGCTEATGRAYIIAIPYVTAINSFKTIVRKRGTLSKEKFMKRNALNRNRRGRK